ncbi:MAG: thiamine phosphate synthase [Rhizobiales bacterium]|nr:thiamine phosphate synthase [Hyphomicrobiales bacterium]
MASILVPSSAGKELVALAQSKGVAVLVAGDPSHVSRLGADGVHVDAEAVEDARRSVGRDGIVGAFAGSSRHLAMTAAEAGADYVALAQTGASVGGEPIVKWWAEISEIPCVAFEPVEAADLDTLLPQTPDFIRPPDAMWTDAETAHRLVSSLTQRLPEK